MTCCKQSIFQLRYLIYEYQIHSEKVDTKSDRNRDVNSTMICGMHSSNNFSCKCKYNPLCQELKMLHGEDISHDVLVIIINNQAQLVLLLI